MRDVQQVVKAIALGVAILLVCVIFASVLGAGMIVGRIFGVDQEVTGEWSEAMISDQEDFSELHIDLNSVSVRLESGAEFQVWADAEVVEFRRDSDRVRIEERDGDWFSRWGKLGGEVRIIVPEKFELERVKLETGAGTVLVDGLKTRELDVDLGAGRAELNGLKVIDETKINGGAGLLVIKNAELKNLDLDMGVGRVEIGAKIIGKGKIDAGVGRLEMDLKGNMNDYRMRFNGGVGAVKLNGEDMGNGATWGDGDNEIEINGGVGAIEIRTSK